MHVDNIWDKLFVSYDEQLEKPETGDCDEIFCEKDEVFEESPTHHFTNDFEKKKQIESVLNDLYKKFDNVLQKRRQFKVEQQSKENIRKQKFKKINQICAIFAALMIVGFFFFGWLDLGKASYNLGITDKMPVSNNLSTGYDILTNEHTDEVFSNILLTDNIVFPFRIFLIIIPLIAVIMILKLFGERSYQDFAGRWSMLSGVTIITLLFAWTNANIDNEFTFMLPGFDQLGLIITAVSLLSVFVITFIYTSFIQRLMVCLICIALSLDLLFEHYGEQLAKFTFLNKFFGL